MKTTLKETFSAMWYSLRTQYVLATVCFMILVLAVFYIGSRIVLVHVVRDAESQMKSIGHDLSRAALHPEKAAQKGESSAKAKAEGHSVEPLVDEAMSFYSGGYWQFEGKPLKMAYAVRDADGKVVSTVELELPNSLTGLTRMALLRLGFFVTLAGILLILLLYFLQNKLLLNPLTRMTDMVGEIGLKNDAVDCPRLEWKGKDEFAQLAVSVNRMLETISRRSLAVAQAEARHRDLIDSLPVGLMVFDESARLVSVLKDVQGVGRVPGLYLGESPAEGVYGADGVARFQKTLAKTMHAGKVGRVRLSVQRPIGARRSQPTRHFDVRTVKLDAYFALAMISDITEEIDEHNRRRLAEIRETDSEKRESLTRLAASIAHDMNNVLSVVLNAAEAESADPSGDSAATLGTIREVVRRGAGMMHELSEYAGELRLALRRMPVKAIVDDLRVLVERVLTGDILVSYQLADDAPDVDVDPNQFWKVIFNIVKNAGEAIGENQPGQIEIGCARMTMTAEDSVKFLSEKPLPPGEGTLFTIKDDGPGIPSEMLPRLFDPYVSSRAVGRGLGLATVLTIVEAHGGGIRVISEPGRGATFEIYLPASHLPENQPPPSSPEAVPTEREVLVVDDDVSILRTTSILLKSMGFVAYVAKDHAEALAILRRHAGGLRAIVLDADLGGVDTVRLLGSFRTLAPAVPVIVSTGSAEDQIRDLFAEWKYDRFLSKPYTREELKKAIG